MATIARRIDKKSTQRLLKAAVHIGALTPLVLMIWDYYQGTLGPDPIRELTLRTGKTAIVLLFLSLAITPAHIWFGWKQIVPLRRLLGLYAVFYVALHLTIFLWLDYLLDPRLIVEALFAKRYALVGLAAFAILLPLAITSNRLSMRKLGKKWKSLHKWVYMAGLLAVLHYFLLVKNAYTEPLIFAVVLALLLLTRVKPVKLTILQWRRTIENRLMRRSLPAKQATSTAAPLRKQ
ncbi:MAG: sulfite oxidase heme-binding subunit YedZ [Candidatus Promineifilaceae bacterium]